MGERTSVTGVPRGDGGIWIEFRRSGRRPRPARNDRRDLLLTSPFDLSPEQMGKKLAGRAFENRVLPFVFMTGLAQGTRTAGAQPDGLAAHRIVRLEGQALATSGDWIQGYQLGGRRVSHIIDPRRREPVANEVASVSVIAPRAMTADALATGLMAMGPEVSHPIPHCAISIW